MRTILTTGGLGYIGSHTTISLIKYGFNVLIIDSLINSKQNTLKNIEKILKNEIGEIKGKLFFRKGDLRNESWLNQIFQEFKDTNNPIESVIHFAGLKSIGESIISPLEYWDNNVNSTLCLLSVMSKFNCYKLIFSSSATVYKTNKKNKITENDRLEPINPYGNTKLCIEKKIYFRDNWLKYYSINNFSRRSKFFLFLLSPTIHTPLLALLTATYKRRLLNSISLGQKTSDVMKTSPKVLP